MTTSGVENSRENGIWYNGTSARESEVPLVQRAARNLGSLTVRVVDNPEKAQGIVTTLKRAAYWQMHPDAPEAVIDRLVSLNVTRFVRDMQPSKDNSHDPLRLIEVESTDGSPVLQHEIDEEIKFRVRPGLAQDPVTPDEIAYTALHPVDPRTMLD